VILSAAAWRVLARAWVVGLGDLLSLSGEPERSEKDMERSGKDIARRHTCSVQKIRNRHCDRHACYACGSRKVPAGANGTAFTVF